MVEKTTTEMRKEAREAFDDVTQTLKQFNDQYESDARRQNSLNEQLYEKQLELKKLEDVATEAQKQLNDKRRKMSVEEISEREELIRTFEEKKAEIQDSMQSLKKQIVDIPKDAEITKGIKSSLQVIAQNLGTAVKSATANVKKVLDTNSREYEQSVLEDIAELSKTEKGRIQAFKKLDDAITEIGFNINDFNDFSEEFVDDFMKFQKNTRELEKAQNEARRMGVQAEIDIFEGKLTPLSKAQVRLKQDELKTIEKTIEENEKLIKQAAQAGDDETIGKILEQNEKLFKESQRLADMGIKTRGMFEKSMFRPEFVDKIRARIEDATIFGKTLGERKGELGEFFDGITPGPIQDAFRGVISAVSPVTSMFKELTKPLKIFPFLFIKLSKLFQKQNKNVADNNKLTEQENKLKKKGNKIQKEDNKQTQIGIFSKAISGVVGFFAKLLSIATPLLLSVTALAGTFFAFKTLMGPLLKKLNIAVRGEDVGAKIDARQNLKEKMKEISPGLDKDGRNQFTDDKGKFAGAGLLNEARRLGISEDDPALAAYRDSLALQTEQDTLEEADTLVKQESGDVTNIKKLLGEDESNLARLQRSLASGELETVKTRGRGKQPITSKVKMTDEMREQSQLEVARLQKTIEERKKELINEQEQLKMAEDYRSEVQQNVSNLQTSVQQNNNSFQASKDSGDGFFMGSLFKPMMEGFGASSQ